MSRRRSLYYLLSLNLFDLFGVFINQPKDMLTHIKLIKLLSPSWFVILVMFRRDHFKVVQEWLY